MIENPTPGDYDAFGVVAISGSKVVVGAPQEKDVFRYSGCAYVFDLAGANPAIPLLTLPNPSPAESDGFGTAIAIDGDRLLISAVGDDTAGVNAGAVYEYNLSGPSPAIPVRVLTNPSPADARSFGMALGVSGKRALISANRRLPGQEDVGVVHVFDSASGDPGTPVFSLQHPAPMAYVGFGASLALEGTKAVVGAAGTDGDHTRQGAAYVYELTGPTPAVPVQTLQSGEPTSHAAFGIAVALAGARVVVGERWANIPGAYGGRVHVFDLASPALGTAVATLTESVGQLSYGFGTVLAISGTTLAVAAPAKFDRKANRGAVLLFGPSPYTAWKHAVLGDHLAPDGADDDADQFSTLAEYGLGSSPLEPNATAFSYAPFVYPDGERLRLFLERDPERVDVSIQVEAADGMSGPWQTVAVSQRGEPFTGPGYVNGDSATPGVKSVEIRDVVTLSQSSRRFLRVRISR